MKMWKWEEAFGAMVWIFQDGNLGAFGTTSTGCWNK